MAEILDPLFDKNGNFVGWLVDRSNVFDKNLRWVAYIFNDYIWAVKTQVWIGELKGTNLLDRDGRIVAWSTNGPVIGGLDFIEAPLDIRRPLPPLPPLVFDVYLAPGDAPEPIGEWSKLTFNQWLNQK
ncbi:4-fold beta flower protein [Clostridium sp.]|uniref:4-fold beta flower protein n=1 Tax=Clostridium sp. TaxID=1506 RepID=UPI002FC8ADFE